MEITYGRIQCAQKVVIYGPEGIGKSTFASRFPEPVFIDTEGSTKHMDVARLPMPQSWPELKTEVDYVVEHPDVCKTLVIDTADWAEQLCTAEVCRKAKKDSIESFGYGKGYVYLSEEFAQLLKRLDRVIAKGINVVITAHAKMRKFEQPDEMGAYDRWEMKLSKNVCPLVKEWADMVLFANYKTYTVRDENNRVKAQGGNRVMYTEHHACWDAKNRYGMVSEVDFTYESIRQYVEQGAAPETPPIQRAITSKPKKNPYVKKPDQVSLTEMQQRQEEANQAAQSNQSAPECKEPDQDMSLAPPDRREPDIPPGTPQALAELMQENSVDACEIRIIVSDAGYYPLDMPISEYDPAFIQQVLVEAWGQVFEAIKKNRENLPF